MCTRAASAWIVGLSTAAGSNAASSGRPQNTNDIEGWEGPSDFDIRHRFVTNFVAELPFGEGKPFAQSGVGAAVLGGWTVSGIFTGRTGRPYTVTQGSLEGATWVPNLVGDPDGNGTVDSWFNAAAFQRVAAGTFGNAGRNSLRGPGYMTFDMTLQRRIALTSRVSTTLRWDVFNLFDRANFGNPNADITGNNVGTISTLAGDPRLMQKAGLEADIARLERLRAAHLDDQHAILANVFETKLLKIGRLFDPVEIDMPDRRRQFVIGLDDREAGTGHLSLMAKRGEHAAHHGRLAR